jgi:hypothetical protein
MNESFTKSAKIIPSKSIFYEKIDGIFILFSLKTIFVKKYSSGSFWTTLLLKSCPIFDQLTFIDRYSSTDIFFPSSTYVDSWPKILLFRTHQLRNSTTELILIRMRHGWNIVWVNLDLNASSNHFNDRIVILTYGFWSFLKTRK